VLTHFLSPYYVKHQHSIHKLRWCYCQLVFRPNPEISPARRSAAIGSWAHGYLCPSRQKGKKWASVSCTKA